MLDEEAEQLKGKALEMHRDSRTDEPRLVRVEFKLHESASHGRFKGEPRSEYSFPTARRNVNCRLASAWNRELSFCSGWG